MAKKFLLLSSDKFEQETQVLNVIENGSRIYTDLTEV